jgi:hypothetical protein
MSSELDDHLRRFVAERAGYRCEYCLLPQWSTLHKHEPDHIIARQHGGQTTEDNLALACFRCNRYKGPNPGSFDPLTKQLVPFFNPRMQRWSDHFKLDGVVFQPLTAEARVTVIILRLNDEERVVERLRLQVVGLYH